MPNLKNASLLTVGQLGTYGCSFARNMILARMLSKADFGLVSVFAMTITLLELTSRMSLGAQIIQSPHGERRDFQNTFHCVLMGVGLISALFIAALALPFSHMFGVPSTAWAFALLGIVPFLKGLEHLDTHRLRRNFNFGPGVLSELIPQIIVTIAAWPLALWLGDFRVILWIVIGKAGLTVLLTHLFAKRSYHWAFNREFYGDMISFSWPLLLNGLLIFVSQQADQFLIGSFLSLEDVAVYAAAYSFAILPFFILAPVQSNLFLPSLSRLQNSPKEFEKSYVVCLQTSALVAVFTLSPILSTGEQIAVLFYGSKYEGTGLIVAILAAACAFRCFRVAPAIAAIAKADTINQFYSNLVRCSSLILASAALMLGATLPIIAACTLLAELAATLYSVYRLSSSQNIPCATSLKPTIILVIGLAISSIPAAFEGSLPMPLTIGASLLILAIELAIAKYLFPEAFKKIENIVARKLRRGK